MSNRTNFTPEQIQVINDRGNNLLVSAAAGSGKTTVMIERIKDLIVKDHVPIENFLVVTFTKASSLDMKARLINKLSQEPASPFLLDQIDNINTADVSNLHSFCARLLKSYFYEAGLDPTFVVLAQEEVDALKQKALNILFDKEFESNNQEFFTLLDCLQKNRSDKELKECILKLHEFFNVIFNKEQWFESCLKSLYNPILDKNQACGIINGYVCGRIEKIIEQINMKISYYSDLQLKDFVAYLQTMESQLLTVNNRNSFTKNAQNLYAITAYGAPPKVDEVFAEHRKELDEFRLSVKKEIENFKENFISDNPDKLKQELAIAKNLAITLYNSAVKFNEIFSELKREKGGLDFNDLEQFTLKVLENPEILNTLKQKYKYVFVDEYQDINAVQEKIITLLSGENNRFMVGDIKQSIYRFRLCDPDIFLEKYNSYKNLSKCKSIDLSKNFRSNKDILNFVNLVFDDRMTIDFGGIDYKETARLEAGSDFTEENPVTLCYINTQELTESKKNAGKVDVSKVYSVKEHEQLEELEHLKFKAESEYIASEILDLVANKTIYDAKTKTNKSIRYKDIAILLPARNNFLDCLLEVFASCGIPVSTDASQNVLTDQFVKSIYNYLKLIYNSKQDIEMFSVLYSPLTDFSLNEIAQLRILEPDCKFFYQSLQNCKQNNAINAKLLQKICNFIQNIDKYRKLAGYKTVKQIAKQIVTDFNIINLILTEKDGNQRLNLLNKFIDILPESNIYEFFADGPLETINAEKSADINAVQIVTIHKSKGLEYPVAFVADIDRQFNLQNMYSNMLISKELGLGVDFFDQQERFKNTSVAKEAIKLTETRKNIEEQQRLLYVALTRAINKLYVFGCKNIDKLKTFFPERKNSFSDWFDSFAYNYVNHNSSKVNVVIKEATDYLVDLSNNKKTQIAFGKAEKTVQQLVEESISNKYLYNEATKLPQKMSVTQIASGNTESEEEYKKQNYSYNKSSIETGNAYHKLMQYIDFTSNTLELLEENINKLLISGKVTKEDLLLIDYAKVLKLLNNKDFINVTTNPVILREKEFFYNKNNSQEVLIVQGIVDLIAIDNNQAIILDYKTGNLKNSNTLSQYKQQLSIYALAIEKSYDVKVIKKAIASLEDGQIYFV